MAKYYQDTLTKIERIIDKKVYIIMYSDSGYVYIKDNSKLLFQFVDYKDFINQYHSLIKDYSNHIQLALIAAMTTETI